MTFQPEIHEKLEIGGITYCIAEHPYAPGMPYGQEGRQAVVYKFLGPDQEEVGLKVFKPRFRVPGMVALAVQLDQFAGIPGLSVCHRTVLSARQHSELLNRFPELTYSVLMPWLAGPTWMEVMLGEMELTPENSLKYARFLTEILTNMEEQNMAHCDLSGPNLIITGMQDPNATVSVALVDVEQMYGPGIQRPGILPGGSPGYAHRSATGGLWSPEADRFAGAVLIAEMLGWCDSRVCKSSWGESFFDPDEMQKDGERYRVLTQVLKEKWGEAIAGLFKRAWESECLLHAPTFGEWLVALPNAVPVLINENPEDIERTALAEELTSESNPVVIERYFIICPNCKTKNEIMPDEGITTLKCGFCSKDMNWHQAIEPEIAATTELMSYPPKKSEPYSQDIAPSQGSQPEVTATAGLLSNPMHSPYPAQWVFLAIGAAVAMAVIMMLGWVKSNQSGEMKIKDLKLSLSASEREIQQLEGIKDVISKMDDSQLLKISDIKLRNENKNGEALGSYTNQFRQKDVHYIWYHLNLENIASGVRNINGKIAVKYFNSDGTLDRGTFSPKECSFYEEFKVLNKAHLSKGWGNDSGGCYEVGSHRIEFWCNDRLLGKTTFIIY